MRKFQQRLILDLIQTIKQAQSEGLYEDCQVGALSVGEFIEGIKGEGTQTVALLEEYCEFLFKASNGEVSEKLLQKCLIQVENSVKSELRPNRIEIAFLSYNASMSDSIESIYIAAKADPDCDAYWIPIPFFERKADGSFGAMHYEDSDCYGGNIECTDWRAYDIEMRHPDVIFTFAPYDAGNYVTSVHPDFYCERLRELTDLLIYIPYFVSADNVEEHFCTIAGCVYAHKVIIQSEKIRETYIRVFKEAFGSEFGKPEDKFIALGSPKFDAVINANRENYKLPEEWVRSIGDKKVILYNTAVGAILQDSEQYLKKLRHVLEVFRERDDVVVWWRPHPLSEATIGSMRPQLLDEYRSIVADYKGDGVEPIGVYDDSSDLHRAIAMSDLYYGDMSSLVALYQATGKPYVIQDVDSDEENILFPDYKLLLPNYITCDGNGGLWFISYSVLYCMNSNDAVIKTVYDFNEIFSQEVIIDYFSKLTIFEGKVYFFIKMKSSRGIIVFDILLSSYEFIPITFEIVRFNDEDKYRLVDSIFFDGKLYFTPSHFRMPIIKLDIASNEISYMNDWDKSFGTELKIVEGAITFSYSFPTLKNDRIMLINANYKVIFEYSLSLQLPTIFRLGDESSTEYSGNGSICFEDESFWMTSSDGKNISKFSDNRDKIIKLEPLFCGLPEGSSYTLNTCIYSNGFIWVFQRYSDDIVKINTKDYSVSYIRPNITPHLEAQWNNMHYFGIAKYEDYIFAFHCKGNVILKLDTLSNSMEYLSLEQSVAFGSSEWKKLLREKNKDVRVFVAQDDMAYGGKDNISGKRIFEYVKNLIVAD